MSGMTPAEGATVANRETHEMLLDDDVWNCIDCGRRMVVQFKPYSRVVLNAGDETAVHVGGTGGAAIRVNRVNNVEGPDIEDTNRA